MAVPVLVIDDDPLLVRLVGDTLRGAGHQVTGAATCSEGRSAARDHRGVILLDLQLPDGLGLDLLPELREADATNPVIVFTGHGTSDLALAAIRRGAFDFLAKDLIGDRLLEAVALAAREHEALRGTSGVPRLFPALVTRAPAMLTVLRSLAPAVSSAIPVLIRGESGTGKELVARGLHHAGPRRDGPFVAINCAGIPEALLEAELFGYERGAFTGATTSRPGRFEEAANGTLFLDEIGDMPLALQAKVLRVLQGGDFRRLGGTRDLLSTARILSATHTDLEAAVTSGRFRQDLYYRLAVFSVELPPLRDRPEDIEMLSEHFVERAARLDARSVRGVEPMVLELLRSYRFPGNVRELENLMRHGAVAARGSRVGLTDLPTLFLNKLELLAPGDPGAALRPDVTRSLKQVERAHIARVLGAVGGNKALAARTLGIGRMTLYRKLAEHGIG